VICIKKIIRIYSKYIFFFLFIIIGILSFIIINPFLKAILAAGIFAYIFFPLYRRLRKWTKSKYLAVIIVIILIIFVVSIPVFMILNTMTHEAYLLYTNIKQNFIEKGAIDFSCETPNIICRIYDLTQPSDTTLGQYLSGIIQKSSTVLISSISDFLLSIPSRILEIFILIFMMFYLFLDGEKLVKKVWLLFPLKRIYQKHVEKQMSDVTYAVVYGNIIVAIVQGVIAGIGYTIFGLPSPILWGFFTIIVALLPVFGTALVWFPASIYLIVTGIASASSSLWNGIGLLIYGFILVGTIDNFIKPKIIGDRARVHPAVVILGVFGGLYILGYIGIFIGPLILALFMKFLELYEVETE